MSDRERIAVGAIGGILVGVVAYPVPAYETMLNVEGGFALLAGWVLRIVGFGFLGGLWAFLHKSENERFKIFQFGVIGPAVISAMIAANVPKEAIGPGEAVSGSHGIAIVSSAHAAERPPRQPAEKPRRSFWSLVVKGFLGSSTIKK